MEMTRGHTKDIDKSICEMKKDYRRVRVCEWNPFIVANVLMLFDKFLKCSYAEYSFCCYGNKRSCWVDIEGQDFGWMFLDFNDDDLEGIREALLKDMVVIVKNSKYENCKILIGENKNRAEILIISEDDSNYILSFNN